MKKTIVAVSVVLMLVLCMGTSVFAASPVAALPAAVDSAGSALPAGATLSVTQAPHAIAGMEAAKKNLGVNGTMLAVVDIQMTGASGAATIRVNCPGLNANGLVFVIHQTATGYELMQANCQNGFFTFTASSFSPFAFVLESAGSPASSGGSTGGSSKPTSPRTGVYEL